MSVPLRWPEDEGAESVIPMQTPLRPRANRRIRRGRRLFFLCATSLVLGVAAVAGGSIALRPMPHSMELQQMPTPKGALVAAGAMTLERKLGYLTVTGSVVNLSEHNFSNVEAVVELLDSRQQTVQVESGLIAFAALPARQSAPFVVETTDNPRATAYRVRFKQLLGPVLN